jgi:hypothetical protein
LVANRYVQHAGVNYDEVFAPVVCLESVRMMVALASYEHWAVHHMDVKSVFLHETLKEEVYVQQASCFIVLGSKHKVLCLHKTLPTMV